MNLDFGKAFTYVTQEPNYIVKILIGGGILFVGFLISTIIGIVGGIGAIFTASSSATVSAGASVVSLVLSLVSTAIAAAALIPILGYGVQVMRNVIAGYPSVTPEWNDFGQLAADGAKAWVCWIAVLLPGYLLSFLGRFPAALAPNSAAVGLVSLCTSCLALPLFFLAAMVQPIVMARYASTGNIGQTLDVAAIRATVQANPGMYALLALATFGIYLAGGIIGAVACLIGIPFAIFFAYLVIFHLYAQAHVSSQGGSLQPNYGNTPYGQRPF